MLCDNYGRIHNYLRISLTEKCNLRCTYCMPEEGIALRNRSLIMNKDEIVLIAETFARLGINKIRLTGGEPLVCKDAHEIISRLSCLPVQLAITTNGLLVDNFIGTFRKACIHSVNVSLDTLNPGRFISITRRNELAKVLSNIDLLLSNKFYVKVNMVVMKGVNDHEINSFIELTREFPIHVRYIEFMPFPGNNWEKEKVFTMENILSRIESEFDIIKLQDERHATTKKYKALRHRGTFAIISTISDPFCNDCNRLRLTADGKMKNCLFSKEEFDLLTPLRKGENIEQVILSCMKNKKENRGGQFDAVTRETGLMENRSMVTIGG